MGKEPNRTDIEHRLFMEQGGYEKQYADNFKSLRKKAVGVMDDIATAQKYFRDAVTRYIKQKTKAKNKREAEDMKLRFKELEPYSYNYTELQDAYGIELITEAQFYRLSKLLEQYETYVNDKGQFDDRVTQIMRKAIDRCGDEYREMLEEYFIASRQYEADQRRKMEADVANERAKYLAGQ